jgi:hypothetical protein
MAHTRPTHRHLAGRLFRHFLISLAVLGGSLGIGMLGYRHYEHLSWTDAFVNAAMLLGGMGPLKQDLSEAGKIFAGFYALYCGLAVIVVTGLMLAPGVHHLMKVVHWESRES